MKRCRKWQRIFILVLLSISVFAPIVFVSNNLKPLSSKGIKQFDDLDDLSNMIHKKPDLIQLHAVEQEASEDVKEPRQEVYRDQNYSVVSSGDGNKDEVSSFEGLRTGDREMMSEPDQRANERSFREEIKQVQPKKGKEDNKDESNKKSNQPHHGLRRGRDSRSETQRTTDNRVVKMKDQVIRAKAYLSFAISSSNTHLVKDLRLRIKEIERVLGEPRRDSDLSRSALQKIKMMESTLSKASHAYPDCPGMVNKLRAMTHNAEDQVQSQRTQTTFLSELAGRTTPKGLHCLSMRLTTEYFTLPPEQQRFPNQQNIQNQNLFHYVVFSDNVLAAAVVVNSTVSNALEPEKIVFHVVTDSLNFPAISMWFLLNPPEKATIQVLSASNFQWLSALKSSLEKQSSSDSKYSSLLNHLRFYLPEIFPQLDKVVFLDHDVVVQRDLSSLWGVDMKGKVNGVVETCEPGESSYRRMDMLVNFSDPLVSRKFDANSCTWAFGMNLFDLRQWRHHDLTSTYRRFLLKGNEKPLWKTGSLPLGWVTFYNRTIALDPRWHLLGLGFDSQIKTDQIEQAAVIHYDGIMKPWLDIGIRKYKGYWNQYVKFDHPYLLQCNLQE
ncbi:putative galacturonosyltransferase 6 isoform X2 [Silene latifolia]|uniref:putative galacturonosyltransferase 6 isoform X2 n=1 Tax=Silene latifolia TaxID=37657 RepID=UPI003D77B83F